MQQKLDNLIPRVLELAALTSQPGEPSIDNQVQIAQHLIELQPLIAETGFAIPKTGAELNTLMTEREIVAPLTYQEFSGRFSEIANLISDPDIAAEQKTAALAELVVLTQTLGDTSKELAQAQQAKMVVAEEVEAIGIRLMYAAAEMQKSELTLEEAKILLTQIQALDRAITSSSLNPSPIVLDLVTTEASNNTAQREAAASQGLPWLHQRFLDAMVDLQEGNSEQRSAVLADVLFRCTGLENSLKEGIARLEQAASTPDASLSETEPASSASDASLSDTEQTSATPDPWADFPAEKQQAEQIAQCIDRIIEIRASDPKTITSEMASQIKTEMIKVYDAVGYGPKQFATVYESWKKGADYPKNEVQLLHRLKDLQIQLQDPNIQGHDRGNIYSSIAILSHDLEQRNLKVLQEQEEASRTAAATPVRSRAQTIIHEEKGHTRSQSPLKRASIMLTGMATSLFSSESSSRQALYEKVRNIYSGIPKLPDHNINITALSTEEQRSLKKQIVEAQAKLDKINPQVLSNKEFTQHAQASRQADHLFETITTAHRVQLRRIERDIEAKVRQMSQPEHDDKTLKVFREELREISKQLKDFPKDLLNKRDSEHYDTLVTNLERYEAKMDRHLNVSQKLSEPFSIPPQGSAG